MLEKGKISNLQFTFLVAIWVIGDTILFIPGNVVFTAKQDGWISSILAGIIGICLVALYGFLGKRFPSMTIIEMNEKVLGLWFGKIVSVYYIFGFLINSGAVLWVMGNFITTQMLYETPIEAVIIPFLIVVMIGTRIGLESLARTAEIFFPWTILLLLVLVLSISSQIELENIQPVLEDGIKPVLRGSLLMTGYYMEAITLLMILPYVNQVTGTKKAYIIGMLIGSIVLFMTVLLSILVLGADITARNIFPSYVLAKKISIGDFFERIEAILAFIWFITVFFKVSILFYATTLGLAQTLKLNDYKVLIFPLALIIYTIALIGIPNPTYGNNFVLSVWWVYSSSFGLFLPLLLLIVITFIKKRYSEINS
jgi:spore germination protein KB